jgi:transcription initiation factor TFIID subunit TAF12
MHPSFKEYLSFLQLTEDRIAALSEEQVNEIFGKFASILGIKPDPSKDLQAKRAQLQQARAKQLELMKRKQQYADERRAAASARQQQQQAAKQVGTSLMVPSGRTSAAAQGRAAELDWLQNRD